MSIENAKAFLEKVKNDEELLKKLSDSQSGEDRLNIAKAEGFVFTKEEMFSVTSELSDDDLGTVSGGGLHGGPCGLGVMMDGGVIDTPK